MAQSLREDAADRIAIAAGWRIGRRLEMLNLWEVFVELQSMPSVATQRAPPAE